MAGERREAALVRIVMYRSTSKPFGSLSTTKQRRPHGSYAGTVWDLNAPKRDFSSANDPETASARSYHGENPPIGSVGTVTHLMVPRIGRFGRTGCIWS